jgi:hypothetical protein
MRTAAGGPRQTHGQPFQKPRSESGAQVRRRETALQKAKGKRQKAKGKRQKAKGKRQKAKGKRQKRSKRMLQAAQPTPHGSANKPRHVAAHAYLELQSKPPAPSFHPPGLIQAANSVHRQLPPGSKSVKYPANRLPRRSHRLSALDDCRVDPSRR